jgi:hypothetical protein
MGVFYHQGDFCTIRQTFLVGGEIFEKKGGESFERDGGD